MSVEEHLAEPVRGLDAGWKQLAERPEEAGPAAKVSIEVQDDGRVKPNVDELGALGLVLNAIVLWTTKYIDAATRLQAEGHGIREEDIARLSPLKHRNLNLLGRYSSTASTPAADALRPAPAARPGRPRTGRRRRGRAGVSVRSRSDQSVTGRHSASRATMSRQARCACRGW
jgi:hypothetical protein